MRKRAKAYLRKGTAASMTKKTQEQLAYAMLEDFLRKWEKPKQ